VKLSEISNIISPFMLLAHVLCDTCVYIMDLEHDIVCVVP
jgi:hypothetical protein